jgi:hypothetical protein
MLTAPFEPEPDDVDAPPEEVALPPPPTAPVSVVDCPAMEVADATL